MARHTTTGNLVTDAATGLTYFKDMAKVIPGFTGVVGVDHGEWNANLGSIAIRDIACVNPTQAFAIGTQMALNKPYANPIDYDQKGDNKWYRCNQTYTPNAYRPGYDSGWQNKWAAIDFFPWSGKEYVTSGVNAYAISAYDWYLYHCKLAYTFTTYKPGADLNWQDKWNGVTAWEGAGHNYSVNDLRSYYWFYGYGEYRCILGYTADENSPPPRDDPDHWESIQSSGDWYPDTDYEAGTVVWNAQQGGYYCCKVNHHSGLDPSNDSTHWEKVNSVPQWAEGTSYSVDNLVTDELGYSTYICTSAHTATYHRPENDDGTYWTAIAPQPRWTTDNPAQMTALYYFCVEAHTASAQAYIGHSSYWRVFDKRWYEWWLSIVPGPNGAAFSPVSDGGVFADLSEVMDAITFLNAGDGTGGHKDWRLPNEFEARVTRCFEDGKLWSALSPPSRPAMSVWYGGPCWVVMFAYWTGTPCKPGDGSNVYAVLVEGLYYPASGGNWVPETPVRKASQAIEYRPAVTDKYAEGGTVVFIARPVRGGVIQS